MPEIHMSFVPILHDVPSAAESPQGTINVSSESVQYNSHGSSEPKKTLIYLMQKNCLIIFTYDYRSTATNCISFLDTSRC